MILPIFNGTSETIGRKRRGRSCRAVEMKRFVLFCSEDAVSGISETGDDVTVIVELFVDGRDVDVYVGMILLHACNAFRRTDQVQQFDVPAAVLLDESDGRAGTSAGGQ